MEHLLPVTFLAAACPGAGRLSGALPLAAVSFDSPDKSGRAPRYVEVPPDVAAPLVPLEARAPAEPTPSPTQRPCCWLGRVQACRKSQVACDLRCACAIRNVV